MLALIFNNARNWFISVIRIHNTQTVHRDVCHTLPTTGFRCLHNQICSCISVSLWYKTWHCSSPLNKICPWHVFPDYWCALVILLLTDPKQPWVASNVRFVPFWSAGSRYGITEFIHFCSWKVWNFTEQSRNKFHFTRW
jgi:hypothetical protein